MIRIELSETTDTHALGASVSGKVCWQPGKPTKYKSVVVTLSWHTEGRGDKDDDTVDELKVPGGETVGSEALVVPFSLNLPDDGPMSYDGRLMRIIWTLRAKADEPWKLGDEAVEQVIRVGPAPGSS